MLKAAKRKYEHNCLKLDLCVGWGRVGWGGVYTMPFQANIAPGPGAKRSHVSAVDATPTTKTPDAKKPLLATPVKTPVRAKGSFDSSLDTIRILR